jgi:hypothetical protein
VGRTGVGWDSLTALVREKVVVEADVLEARHQERLVQALNEFSANAKGDARGTYEQRLQVPLAVPTMRLRRPHTPRLTVTVIMGDGMRAQKQLSEHYAQVRSANEAASERDCQALADAVVQQITYVCALLKKGQAAFLAGSLCARQTPTAPQPRMAHSMPVCLSVCLSVCVCVCVCVCACG